MKKLKIINEILLSIALVMLIFSLVKNNLNKEIKEDLNKDGVVDSADLLYLRKYLIRQGECNCNG